MTIDNHQQHMDIFYGHIRSTRSDVFNLLDQSFSPRSPKMLYDVVAELSINANHSILDAGSGLGNHSCGLASKFGCHVVGLDIVESNLAVARTRANQEHLTELVSFQQGNIQSLPFDSAAFDLVWCRNVLMQVHDLQQALSEFVRVLKPNGTVLIHTIFATALMEPGEATYLYKSLELVPANMSPTYFEEIFKAVGLHIRSRESIGSEWEEYAEEQDGHYSKELLYIARMRRCKDEIVAKFGQGTFDVIFAFCQWHMYLLLGKLSSTIYTLSKVSSM